MFHPSLCSPVLLSDASLLLDPLLSPVCACLLLSVLFRTPAWPRSLRPSFLFPVYLLKWSSCTVSALCFPHIPSQLSAHWVSGYVPKIPTLSSCCSDRTRHWVPACSLRSHLQLRSQQARISIAGQVPGVTGQGAPVSCIHGLWWGQNT